MIGPRIISGGEGQEYGPGWVGDLGWVAAQLADLRQKLVELSARADGESVEELKQLATGVGEKAVAVWDVMGRNYLLRDIGEDGETFAGGQRSGGEG